tara:strand:- start:485 stop:592 length:108 start_codon:yes stop_codon:yes gene_type:complete
MEKEMQTQLVESKSDQQVPNQEKQPSAGNQISHRV